MDVEGTLFDRLAVLDDPVPHRAAFNMAADEALLDGLDDLPLLRLYRWKRPSVSFGYFTPYASVAEEYLACELVRRWTGGGVVEHGGDVTYSLLVPRVHPLTNRPAGESYRLIHEALQRALETSGCGMASFAPEAAPAPDIAARGCFGHPVLHDLLSEGRKVGGAAQRRTRRGLLHQGSILLPGSTPMVLEGLIRVLPMAFGQELYPRHMAEAEQAAADRLACEKYAADTWTLRV